MAQAPKRNAMKIAVIAGDGIGNEVVPEGIKVLEAVGRKYDLVFQWDTLRLVMRGVQEDRQDDAGRRAGPNPAPRRHFPRRSRLSGRARPRLAVGPADPDPA